MKFDSTRPWLVLAFATALILLFLNSLLYTYYNSIPLLKSDSWRFVQLYLKPWYTGELTVGALWSDHHPQPLTALLFIANAEYFSLRMDYEALLAVPFLFFTYLLVSKSVTESIPRENRTGHHYILLLVIASVLFSLTSRNQFVWSLVTLGFISLFFYVLCARQLQFNSQHGVHKYTLIVPVILFSIYLVLFSSSAKLYVYATLISLFIHALLTYRKRKWVIHILLLIGALFINAAFMALIGTHGKYTETELLTGFSDMLCCIPDFLSYIGIALLSSWVNIKLVSTSLPFPPIGFVIMGQAILLLYIITLIQYYRSDLSKQTILPGAFILIAFLTAIAGALFRFDPQTEHGLAGYVPRYYKSYALGLTGFIWVWGHFYLTEKRGNVSKLLASLFICFITLSQTASTINAWKASPYIRNDIVYAYETMLQNARGDFVNRPPTYMVRDPQSELYLSGLRFLKRKRLNVFQGDQIIERYQ